MTVERSAWPRPAVFDWLAETGNVAPSEMDRTFNNGIGYCIVVPADQVEAARATLAGR